MGVTLYLEEELREFETRGGKVTGIVTDKRTLPADIVILGSGFDPTRPLPRRPASPLGKKGRSG